MTYLRCTREDCRQVHAPAPGSTFEDVLERAEQPCDECGQTPLAIFAGSPPEVGPDSEVAR